MGRLFASARSAIEALRQRRLLAAVGMLVSGTGLAAIIAAGALPILTRFYTPADFGVLAALTSLVSLISVAAALRFDIAIPLPERDDDGINVLAVALVSAALVTMVICAVLAIGDGAVLVLAGQSKLLPFVWLVPLGIFAMSANIVLQAWFIRDKDFGFIARNRVMQAIVTAGSQIGVGLISFSKLGLLVAPTFGLLTASAALAYRLILRRRTLLASINPQRMKDVFVRYDRFPKFSAIEAFANVASIQVPILIIAAFLPASEAGYLLLAITIIQAPMGLLGSAIAQVFLSHAPEQLRAGRLGAFTTQMFAGLMKTGVGPLLFGGIVAPELFTDIFGPDWRRSGLLLAWMTPWFVMQYLVSPISMILHVTNRQPTALFLQVLGVVIRVPAVYFAATTGSLPASEIYALSGFIFYAIYLLVVLRVSGVTLQATLFEATRSLPFVGAWIALALVVLYATRLVSGTY